MQKFQTLPDAIALAEFGHRNQLDKANFPYIEHPKRVLAGVQAQGGRPFVQIAAVLHDIVEDTPITLQMLLDFGFSPAAVHLVDLVTRKAGQQPNEYYALIRENPDAVMIKHADITDNTLAWRLNYLPEDTQERLRRKYATALHQIGIRS